MEATSLWGSLRQATSQPDEGRLGLWAWLQEKLDLTQYRPEAAPGVVARQLTGREGEYVILKNPDTKTYYRLSDRDYFLWQLMDGTKTVKDLVVAYFLQYGSFAFARVAALVVGLKASLFLTERPVYVYQQVRDQLQRRRPTYRLAQFWQAFLQKQFAIGGLDHLLGGLYRWGGRLLFTWPLQVLHLIVSAVGLVLFVRAFNTGTYGVVTIAGSYRLGIIGLIVANLAVIFVHEMAHALTVKHYGREARRGGFMIYFGMPAFFMDTTDIWLEGKRARLAVSWAGPHSGLIVAGLASIVITLWPTLGLNALLFQVAFLSYLTVFFNLNPLLELDSYYLLMDWLEIPMLRRKSLEFIRTGLWERLKGIRKTGKTLTGMLTSFSREEMIFTVFGLLSAAWTAYAVYAGGYFWQARLAGAVRSLWAQGGDVGRIALSLVAVAVSLPFVLSIGLYLLGLARKVLGWAAQRGLFARAWNVAAMLLVVAVALALAPGYLGYPALLPLIGLLALAAATFFAWRNALDYAGSRFAPAFWLLGLCPLTLLLGEVGTVAVDWHVLSPDVLAPVAAGLGHLAYASLLLAGLLLFADTNLKELRPLEKALLALGLVASYALVVFMAQGQPAVSPFNVEALLAVSGSLFPLLALTLLVPTLFSFWRTGFGPAWVTLCLALAGLVAVNLLGLSPLFPYLLLVASFLLHHLAYRQVTFLTGQPEATLDLSDLHRLQRAFAWTVASVSGQFRETGGERYARVLAEQFNNYALAAGWRVRLAKGQVEDSLPADLSLIERGEIYAATLTLLLDMVAQEVGEKLTVRALQRAYDGLPWEEREVGAQYLFRDVKRAEALSREFQAAQQDHRGLLRRMPLFATMDEAEIELLLSRLRVEHYSPGQVIIRQGERGDRFYIIRRGHVEVTQRDERGVSEVVNQLDRGDYFGELALLRDAPRNATCRATIPTEVLSLSRQDFDRLVKARFALREKVDRSIAQADLLRRMPLFAELDALQIQLIVAQLREETYEPGAIIIRQGEIGETFYVIESGRVQVSVAQDGEERVVAERGPGEYVGEIALLLKVPRTATVRALTPTRMLTLHKDDFDQLVVKRLYVSRGLERETSRRMIDLRRAAPSA
ncbi:MAG: cyclic nucleotide-binding domain-containing protein [Chloroflexi bacterium]|nr:cyclic nucleotide-binding domain-containing protein [Chloroflexota bacterium]